MTALVCPAGHVTQATDYCDTCGAVLVAAGTHASPGTPDGAAPARTGATSTSAARPGGIGSTDVLGATVANGACPTCGAPARARALFCENCGHDFTTDAPPASPSRASFSGSSPSGSSPSGSSPSGSSVPGSSVPGAAHAPSSDPAAGEVPAAETDLPSSSARLSRGWTGSARISTPTHAPESTSPTAPSPPASEPWVVEVWTDPQWYEAQQAAEPLPAPAPPGLVLIRERSVLVGRTSHSRNIHPQVDCGDDTGVSRRHCQLNTDGRRWWVEDLRSSNGTYVGTAGARLPSEALRPGDRREVLEGDRVYLGAWTRLSIRRALPGEF